MSSVTCDTLILSDLHLGSELSRAHDARAMLTRNSFRRLILLGDIFSDLNFGRLTKDHWKFLGLIRKLSNPRRKIEVVWVEGNHDRGRPPSCRTWWASGCIRNMPGNMTASAIWLSTDISLIGSS